MSQSSFPTHPPLNVILKNYTAFVDMEATKAELQNAINRAFATGIKPYNNVIVMKLYWSHELD